MSRRIAALTKLVFTALAGITLASTMIAPTYGETVPLNKLDRATRVYIQRSLPGADSACFDYLVKLIDNPKAYYVEFDDPEIDGIAVGAYEFGDYYTCEKGVLSNWDVGDQTIIKKFN